MDCRGKLFLKDHPQQPQAVEEIHHQQTTRSEVNVTHARSNVPNLTGTGGVTRNKE